ncbi:MAG: DNA primase [Candidatus Goldbacteria bacterium]|nr:DNA primase [Candidatus Goldiibacteriota bacterium]
MIPNEIIEQIKDSNDIVDVISDYVSLKKAGASYKALCPFHQEKTPSFMVSSQKQIFHCFGCGVGGNVFSFIQKMENINFIESVKLLAKRAGITINEYKSEYKSSEKEKILAINRVALEYFREQFFKNEKPGKYLKLRGITEEAVEEFKLGYAPEGNGLYLRLKEKKFSDDIILKSWLCRKIESENTFIDNFRERLIFPIFNIFSEPIAFGGRVFDDSLPKYINSADTPVFMKGRNLYNLNNAKKYSEEFLVLVEGYMDAIRLFSEGIKNVVATLGTALTEDQAKILKRYTSKVVILYDMDEAGRKSAIRAGDIGFKIGLEILIAHYNGAKDPDDFIKVNGISAMKKVINESIPFIDYKIDFYKKQGDINNTYYKEKILNQMVELIASVDNLVLINDSVKKVAKLLSLDTSIVEKYLNKKNKNLNKKNVGADITGDLKLQKRAIDMAERAIVQCALISLGSINQDLILKHIYNRMKMADIDYKKFNNKIFIEILSSIEKYYIAKEKNILNKIQLDYIENEEIINLISKLLSEEEKEIYKSDKNKTTKIIQVINDCVDRIEKEKLSKEVKLLQSKIEEAEKINDYESISNFLKEKQKLVKLIKKRGDDIE